MSNRPTTTTLTTPFAAVHWLMSVNLSTRELTLYTPVLAGTFYTRSGAAVRSYAYLYGGLQPDEVTEFFTPDTRLISLNLLTMHAGEDRILLLPSTPFTNSSPCTGPVLPGTLLEALQLRTSLYTRLLTSIELGTANLQLDLPFFPHPSGEPGEPAQTPHFDITSDGSYKYNGPGDRHMGAGAVLCAKDDGNRAVCSMVHIPNAASWTQPNAYLPWDPAPLSSLHSEAAGVLETLTNARMHKEESVQVLDNTALLTHINRPEEIRRETTNHGVLRTVAHDLKNQIVTHDKFNTRDFSWIKAHNSDPFHDLADLLAKLAAHRPQPFPEPQFPASPQLFHLFFQHSLVVDDGRAHMRKATELHHLLVWKSHKNKGSLLRAADRLETPIVRSPRGCHTRWGEQFIANVVANTLPMPLGLRGTNSKYATAEAKCPLCGVANAGQSHLLTCQAQGMLSCDPHLDRDMIDLVALPVRELEDTRFPACMSTAAYEYIPHPALTLLYAKLFPYDTDTPQRLLKRNATLTLARLPEGRFYSSSVTRKNTVEVHHPTDPEKRHQHVVDTEFWRLIAQHRHTHSPLPLTDSEYAQRAKEIFECLEDIPIDQANDKLSYATSREPLRIIVEELDCGTELFSHLLNTFHMMPNHCTDRYDAVAPFDLRRGRAASVMLLNGLDPVWWEGSVYGNPPYGRIIERTRKLAARTAADTAGFRATLVIPLEDGVIHNLSRASGQMLAVFPNGSFPFIPAGHWRGEEPLPAVNGRPAQYRQDNTRIAIVLYQSTDVGELKPFNIDSLHSRLAKWYIGAAPRELLTNFKLKSTNIPLDFFKEPLNTPLADAFPNCWKFWNASVGKPDPLSAPYHGGFEDSYSIRGTPYRNVVLHEPLLAMIGTLPAQFELFLHGQGHTPGKQTKAVLNQIKRRLYKHLRLRWTTYQRLVHTARRQAEADAVALAAEAAVPPSNHSLLLRRTLPDRQAMVEHPDAALQHHPAPLAAA